MAMRTVDLEQLILFLKDNILSKSDVPKKFIIDDGSIFIGFKFTIFCGEYGIIMRQSSKYYPQGNGLAESTKKMLIQIINGKISANHKNWH